MTSSGSITLLNGASAVATKANAALNIGSLSSFAITFPPAGAPVTLSPGQKKAITPGSYGDVHIYANSVLTLSAGNYYFQSLFVEPQAVIAINTAHGPVRVFAKNGLTFRGGVASLDGGAPAPMFLLGYLGTAQAPIESAFDGTIVAPNAKLVLSSLVHNGGFYARQIEAQAGATINYVPTTFSWLPTQ